MLLRRHHRKQEEMEKSEPPQASESGLKESSNAIAYDDITVDEITSRLDELKVEYKSKDTKSTLYKLLSEAEGWK